MLDNVIAALKHVSCIASIDVLSSDPALVPEGCRHIDDVGDDLNTALCSVARALVSRRVDIMLVLPADLPFVTPVDIEALFAAAHEHPVVIAPDATQSGTNALLLSPPTLSSPRFGVGSFNDHMGEARAAGASVAVVSRAALERDIDVPTDPQILTNSRLPRYSFLSRVLRSVS
jgi:2-phospho-L-lactate guanylyltransferase